MNNKLVLLVLLVLFSTLGNAVFSASTQTNTVVDCSQLFQGSGNTYLPTLAGITRYNSIISIALLIILMVLMVSGVAYAFGFAFHIETLLTFAKTEFLEAMGNLAIIAVVAVGITFAAGPLYFFANFASLQAGTGAIPGTSAHSLYYNLCNNVQNNIIITGLNNFFGVFLNLYITNFFAVGSPPVGGLTLHLMPDGFGIALSPFQGMSVVTALLWDMQLTYIGSVFMGMFTIILLFIIYFLFPIFLYVGIVLRSFPWTRPAGGSLIALFIAFYIIFPAIMYPFIMGNPVNNYVNPEANQGFCSNSQFQSFSGMCNTGNLLSLSTLAHFSDILNFQFGDLFYSEVYAFINGIEGIGMNLVGLIIALLISYELVEKIGSILGSPSLQGSRALSRIL